MWKTIKKYALYAVMAGLLYLMLANHYIYVGGKTFRILKKETLNLKYTFFSIQKKMPETIMKIDDLRRAGMGEILWEEGFITEDEKIVLEHKFGYE